MKLNDIIISKIKELGTKSSGEYFGVKEATVKMWLNTQKFPASAAQKVLDDQSDQVPPGEQAEAAPQDLLISDEPQFNSTPPPRVDVEREMIRNRLDDLNKRVTSLERNQQASWDSGAPAIANEKPGYGFTGGAPETVMVPAGPKPVITTQSQVVPPAQPQPSPATMLPKPYLPGTTGSWAQPWPRRNNNL